MYHSQAVPARQDCVCVCVYEGVYHSQLPSLSDLRALPSSRERERERETKR